MNVKNIELAAITKTANLYIDGVRTGNIELLKRAFHPKAMMYGVSGDAVTIVEIDGLYAYVAANESAEKRSEPHQCFITGIDYVGNAAFVQMTEESSHGFDYSNYFLLLKIEGTWLIMSKSYNAVKRP